MYTVKSFFKHSVRSLALGVSFAMATLAQAAEFGVSPMLIEMNGAPDVSQDFKVQVIGKTAGNAKVSLYQLHQLPTGHMDFVPASQDEDDMANWISLEKNKFSVRKDETVTLSGSIKVPRKASGTHLAAIMVEEDQPAKRKGVTLNVRYAVVVSMNIAGGQRGRTQTTMQEVGLLPQSDRVFLKSVFKNEGKTDGMLDSELQLRDAANRLVLKTPLKTQSAWERKDKGSRVFPGSEVVVFGELPRNLPSGTYTAFIRNKFADRAQPLVKENLELPRELFAAPVEMPATPAAPTPASNPEATVDNSTDSNSTTTTTEEAAPLAASL